jgi:hypothetical protein
VVVKYGGRRPEGPRFVLYIYYFTIDISSVGDPDSHVFGLPDPDPLARGNDPDRSLFS